VGTHRRVRLEDVLGFAAECTERRREELQQHADRPALRREVAVDGFQRCREMLKEFAELDLLACL
jgi:hypothetical protein